MNVLHSFQAYLHTMHSTLRRLDLNLLTVFDALYRCRSVAAAADELAMSPSACSHALARLRNALSDELFVRYGNAMQPTAQADQMAGAIGDALRQLADGLGQAGPFIAARSTQSFVLTASDFTAFAFLPGFIARIAAQAPHVRINVLNARHRDSLDDLAAGRAHFVLGIADEFSGPYEGIEVLDGLTDDYVIACRQGHDRIGATLSLDQYLAERHVAVMPWSDAGSVIDAALARHGWQRDVAVRLPSLLAAPFIVAHSPYLITLPRRVAVPLSQAAPLVLHEAPFETPRYTLKILFHARHAGSPAHRWMREQMMQELREGA
ncbi:MAG: LysR family transcriptional regulator [Rhodocyclaceae bacterium]